VSASCRDPGTPADWTWIRTRTGCTAPQASLLVQALYGSGWKDNPPLTNLVRAVTTDIRLDAAARCPQHRWQRGAVRLNGDAGEWGPAVPLAGARPRMT